MADISSIIIQAFMAKIKKEVDQLEHCLLNLSQSTPLTKPLDDLSEKEMKSVTQVLESLSKKMDTQQQYLDAISSRMEALEQSRPIHIDDDLEGDDVWMSQMAFENELVPTPDGLDEITVVKQGVTHVLSQVQPQVLSQVLQQEVKQEVVEVKQEVVEVKQYVVEVKQEVVEVKQEVVEVKQEVVEVKQEVVEVKQDVVEEVEEVEEEEEVEEVEEVEEGDVVEEEEVAEEVAEEEEEGEVVEEEEEKEEEEEGIELEEVTFQGKTYYKATDDFIYEMDASEQLSEIPVGIWKEKSQSIVFYKKK